MYTMIMLLSFTSYIDQRGVSWTTRGRLAYACNTISPRSCARKKFTSGATRSQDHWREKQKFEFSLLMCCALQNTKFALLCCPARSKRLEFHDHYTYHVRMKTKFHESHAVEKGAFRVPARLGHARGFVSAEGTNRKKNSDSRHRYPGKITEVHAPLFD